MPDTLRTEAALLALLIVGGDRDIGAQDLRDAIYSLFRELNGDTGANVPLLGHLTRNTSSGDEGVDCSGEIHVGRPGAGKEMVVGEGDSHTTGMVVYCWDGSDWSDVTTAAASGSGSTFPSFGGGTGVGAAMYVGGDLPFDGLKWTHATTLVPGVGLVVAREYWNGSAWVAFKAMATDANTPYAQRGDNIGTVAAAEQVRFSELTGHAQNIVNGTTKYWVRFVVTAGSVSVAGTEEQIKLHTNRWECNADGFTEYFGDGRYEKDLLLHWQLGFDLSGFSPSNENITPAAGMVFVYTDNEFTAGATDGRGGYLIVPRGLDTSKDVRFELLWTPLNNNAGDVVLDLDTVQVAVGDTLDGTATPATETTTEAVASTSDNRLYKTEFMVDVENLLPGEILFFVIKRIGGIGGDTYAGSIGVVNMRAVGTFWHP